MAVTIEGGRAFDPIIEQIDGLADDRFLFDVAQEMGVTIQELIQQGFRGAVDPYGLPWAPRKLAAGRRTPPHLPLDLTGNMRGSFHVEPSTHGVDVTNPVTYSPFINYGTRFMVARGMLPDGQDLGTWEAPLTDAAQRVFNRHINRAA